MSSDNEYVIDGSTLNTMLDPYNFEGYQPTSQLHHMLPSQVFDTLEKKFLKDLLAKIENAKPQTVKFVNLEAIATGPHKDYMYAIAGSLCELIDNVSAKNMQVSAIIQNPMTLPWNLVARLDKTFKGLSSTGQQAPP